MLKEEDIKVIEYELKVYNKVMCDAIDTILNEDVSKYPIFIGSQDPIQLGIPLATKEVHAGNWNINVSTLEEFATKNIIEGDKIEEFKKVFKDPNAQICMFLYWKGKFTFVFLPRDFINS